MKNLDDALSNSKKANNSDDLDEGQYYARKAMDDAEHALKEARSLDCPKAERYAKEAYDYAHSAYNSDSIDDVQYYAQKAIRAAEDAISEIRKCKREKKDN